MSGHPCPGCGTDVDRPHTYACGDCWRRLPSRLRLAILQAWGRRQRRYRGAAEEHETAKAAAATWYRENPR